MYVTPAQLAERPGAEELSQTATASPNPPVDPLLLTAVIQGIDTSTWPPAQVALAQDALARINDAIGEAGGIIEGFLFRAGYTVPLTQTFTIVTAWARAITRYLLHKDRIADPKTDPIGRAYLAALNLLGLCVKGQFSLGVGDPVSNVGAGDTQVQAPDRVFTTDTLGGFVTDYQYNDDLNPTDFNNDVDV